MSLAIAARLPAARWALLFGNFAIGCGVMVIAGTLNDLAHSLDVSISLAGQLIAISAAVMCFGAPLLAGVVSGFDRRRLLAASLLWYAAGHALCMLAPSYALLWPVRALSVLGAAVFTPQAAAAVGFMAPPEQRGRAMTFIFLGWSLASVAGMPLAAWLGESFGWRMAFFAVALLALAASGWVWVAIPDGVKPAALSRQAWRQAFTHPVLMAIVAVTALQAAGQFTLFSYMAPYYRLALGASPAQIGALFAWFGAFGLLGNVLVARHIDRVGAARVVTIVVVMIGVSLLLWPFATTFTTTALVLVPWALGCFAANSAQQARLGIAAPGLAAALLALNTSAIYFGQAVGAASGGWLVAHGGFAPLSWVGVVWLLGALGVSLWAARRTPAGGAV